jgi:guanosine-3',5'-bis(diphosphate) 3'-pyrophosphohydrolase
MAEETTTPVPRERSADVPVSPRSMRARLARIGAKAPSGNPVLEPLFRAVRANHPKADLALLERAYGIAEQMHDTQMR